MVFTVPSSTDADLLRGIHGEDMLADAVTGPPLSSLRLVYNFPTLLENRLTCSHLAFPHVRLEESELNKFLLSGNHILFYILNCIGFADAPKLTWNHQHITFSENLLLTKHRIHCAT